MNLDLIMLAIISCLSIQNIPRSSCNIDINNNKLIMILERERERDNGIFWRLIKVKIPAKMS